MAQSRRQFLTTLAAAFFGSALIRRITPAEINPSWITAKPLPPSEGIALDWWSQVGDEALRILESELRCLKLLAVDEGTHRRIGDHVRFRVSEPVTFGPDIWTAVDPGSLLLDRSHAVLLDCSAHVELHLPEDIRGMTLPRFSGQMIEPAMIGLADNIFRASRGADLIVTAPAVLPPTTRSLPAATLASSRRLHLSAITYDSAYDPYPVERAGNRKKVVRFSILYGALRA